MVPPDGGKPVGYTRATTVAKTLDDGGGLIPWKATATVVGTLRRPGILASWQALIGEHPDPWYGSQESKGRCKKLVEQAAEAGGSTDRADIGTALHALIEQAVASGWAQTPILQPGMQADIDAYRRTLDTAGIIIDPTHVEAVVVLDQYSVAGTSDNLSIFVPGYGHVVGDLKTGADLKYSWQAIAIQLAIYANSSNVYRQGAAADGSADERLPMPDISKEWGLVIHLPAGEARCELHLVDLVAGWEAFKLSMSTRAWRTRKDVAKPLVLTAAPATAIMPAESADIPDFDAQPPLPASNPAPDPKAITASGPVQGPPPFDDTLPAVEPPAPLTPQQQVAQVRTEPDDGGQADDASFAVLQARYLSLDPDARSWIQELTTEAMQALVSFHAKGLRTIRRFEILRGLISLCEARADDAETLRCVLASVIGDVAHFPAVTPGHALGSLDATDAAQFAQRAGLMASGEALGSVDEVTGQVVLSFPSLAANAA